MALINLDFESQYLHGNTQVTIILPDRSRAIDNKTFFESGKKYKVLWLLHGTHGNHTDWLRKSKVEVYARERELICVMPAGLNSNYSDWDGFATGFGMYSMVTKELVPLIHNWFPASSKPEDNFVAGLSMGGQGALKFALNCPEIFGGGAVLSYAPQNMDAIDDLPGAALGGDHLRVSNVIKNAGGLEALRNSMENSWRQTIELHKENKLPKLYFACGTMDFLYDGLYVPYKKMCEANQIDIHFEEEEGLGHEWRFWDVYLEKALDYFEIKKVPHADEWRGLKTIGFLL